MTGVIDGHWPYVWAAYALTWLFLVGYAVSLMFRRLPGDGADGPDKEAS